MIPHRSLSFDDVSSPKKRADRSAIPLRFEGALQNDIKLALKNVRGVENEHNHILGSLK